jgi:hypothetical protein
MQKKFLDFVRNEPQPNTAPQPGRFPLRIVFPPHPWLAVPEGWQRLPDGRILATFQDLEDLRWIVAASLAAREEAETEAVRTHQKILGKEQMQMFAPPARTGYEE